MEIKHWETSVGISKVLELDGKRIAYTDQTEFLVQVGKGKGSYKTKAKFTGNLAQAIMHYNMINIGNGYKKRLIAPSFNKPVIARQLSI